MEIESKFGKTGAADSAAVQEANQLAVELAQYDGPMAKVFEAIQIAVDLAIESDSTGQSIEDILDLNRIKNSYLTGSYCPSCKSREDCDRDCESKKKSSDTQTSWETVGGAAICIGLGTAGEILSLATANLPGFFLSFGGKYVCLGTTVYNAYQSFSGNDDTYDQCMEKCRYKFPKLDGG
ncbi:MAG: hypothetical protein F4155_08790 [Acidimicrobiales bacterium]|nr:hypothetical protein [Acidimicrobiales bacterium]MYH74881.1 hypothetical protein [Acidimicrobiales bacterium]